MHIIYILNEDKFYNGTVVNSEVLCNGNRNSKWRGERLETQTIVHSYPLYRTVLPIASRDCHLNLSKHVPG